MLKALLFSRYLKFLEYNMRNIFLEKSYIKRGGETIPKPFFLKKKNEDWAYLKMISLKFYKVCFDCMPSWGLSKYNEIKLPNTCFYLIRKRSGTSFPANISFCYIQLTDKISLSGCVYLWDIGQYGYCNCLLSRLWRHKFLNQIYISNQAVFSTCLKNILKTKRAFKIK